MSRSAFFQSLFNQSSSSEQAGNQRAEVGTIWKIKNKFWQSRTLFAQGKDPEAIHPGLVVHRNPDATTLMIAPGSSKKQGARCVVKVESRLDKRVTHYILKLAIPMPCANVEKCKRGIGGKKKVSGIERSQLEEKSGTCLSYPKMVVS